MKTDPLQFLTDEGLLRTNPVLCLTRLLEGAPAEPLARLAAHRLVRRIVNGPLTAAGIWPPPFTGDGIPAALRALARADDDQPSRRPGPVGLVATKLQDETERIGLSLPLHCRLADAWEVPGTLPFRPERIQALILGLVRASGHPAPGALPERLSFRYEDRLGRDSAGPSMDIAAVLSALDALTGHGLGELACACALVQPSVDKPGRLQPVQEIPGKLTAFLRENGRGTLVIVHPSTPLSDGDAASIDRLWEVETLEDLGTRLFEIGALAPLMEALPLDAAAFAMVLQRLEDLVGREGRHEDALALAMRVETCGATAQVPADRVHRLRLYAADAARHLGRHLDATSRSGEELAGLQGKSLPPSYTDEVFAAISYAASLYSPHRFREMVDLLSPWARRLAEDPRLVPPRAIVMVNNTLARALVALGEPGWESLLDASLDIQRQTDPASVPRTLIYRIHGLLRANRLNDAELALDGLESGHALDRTSDWFRAFLWADLARRRGETWEDPVCDHPPEGLGAAGHALAFYLQATARQPGRPKSEAIRRLDHAQRLLLDGLSRQDTHNIRVFLAAALRLYAAKLTRDRVGQESALLAICQSITSPMASGLAAFYKNSLATQASTSSTSAPNEVLGSLLENIPFL
ncbi:MAG: hypothetical protein ABIK09_08355 [Pseudomonadota bacterium]